MESVSGNVPTDENPADYLHKLLGEAKFRRFVELLVCGRSTKEMKEEGRRKIGPLLRAVTGTR